MSPDKIFSSELLSSALKIMKPADSSSSVPTPTVNPVAPAAQPKQALFEWYVCSGPPPILISALILSHSTSHRSTKDPSTSSFPFEPDRIHAPRRYKGWERVARRAFAPELGGKILWKRERERKQALSRKRSWKSLQVDEERTVKRRCFGIDAKEDDGPRLCWGGGEDVVNSRVHPCASEFVPKVAVTVEGSLDIGEESVLERNHDPVAATALKDDAHANTVNKEAHQEDSLDAAVDETLVPPVAYVHTNNLSPARDYAENDTTRWQSSEISKAPLARDEEGRLRYHEVTGSEGSTRTRISQEEDETNLLQGFLHRVKAEKAARGKKTNTLESSTKTTPSRSLRTPLQPLDHNSPSPRKSRTEPSLNSASTDAMDGEKRKPVPDRNIDDEVAAAAAAARGTSSRRSQRRAPPRQTISRPKSTKVIAIPYHFRTINDNNDGDETKSQPEAAIPRTKTAVQLLAALTKANTKRNKAQTDDVTAAADEALLQTRKEEKKKKKSVSWDQKLAVYPGEGQRSDVVESSGQARGREGSRGRSKELRRKKVDDVQREVVVLALASASDRRLRSKGFII